MHISYYQYFQYLSLLIALIWYKDLKRFSLQWMVPLLISVACIESLATNYLNMGLTTNVPIYNVYLLVSPVFYFLMFRAVIGFKGRYRAIFDVVVVASMIFFIADFFSAGQSGFNSISYIISAVEYMLFSCILLSKLIMDDTRPVYLVREPYFWIAAVVIIFSLVAVVITGLHSFIVRNHVTLFGKNLHRVIMPMVNVVMYSGFSYAFYLCRKHRMTLVASEEKRDILR